MYRLRVLVLAASVVLASCGDDGPGDPPSEPERIGRGREPPALGTTVVELRGCDDYTTGGGTAAGLLEIEIASGTILNRAYLRFDVASLGLPAATTVVAATLSLTVYRENGGGGGSDVLEARHLTASWTGAGDVAYEAPPAASDGVVSVPDLPAGSSADPNVHTPPQAIALPLDAALVELWIADAANNRGIALVPALASNGLQLHVFASEESTSEYRPALLIEYSVDDNSAPVASVTVDVASGPAPLTVALSGTGTDADGTVVAWRYDFDDGTVAYEPALSHTFARAGTYFVNFTVADDGGATATDIVVVTVAPPTPATHPSIPPHPPGGEPDASTESCAAGMARPLPSSRRDVLVWADQVGFDTTLDVEQAVFIARRMVGTQKVNQRVIEAVRVHNPLWRVLQYHLAYGLTRAGDYIDVNTYGPEKDAFDAWISAHGFGTTHIALLVIQSPLSTYASSLDSPDWDVLYGVPGLFDGALRYGADFYFCDIAYDPGGGPLWHRYIVDETLRRMTMNGIGFECDGTFFDTSSLPGPNLEAYCGSEAYRWYNDSDICAIASGADYNAWWNVRARAYYDAVRGAYAAGGAGHRYLVLPNSNRMLTNWAPPDYLASTDGAFVESFGCGGADATIAEFGPGEFERSAARTLAYITGAGKVMLAAPDCSVTAIAVRRFAFAQFLLLKNDTCYYELNAKDLGTPPNGQTSNPQWYPEYEIDLGCYLDPAPSDLASLRVTGGDGGGLYARWYAGGLVLVNSSLDTTYEFALDMTYYPVTFTGGGYVDRAGQRAAQTLETTAGVSGTYALAANSVAILRAAQLP